MCDRFFNPTIEVVTFHLRRWRMLGVFLLPAFTRLGHACQELAFAHRLDLGLYSHRKEFVRGMESEPTLTQRENPIYRKKISSEEEGTHDAASSRTASPTRYQRSCPGPQRRKEPMTLYQAGQRAQHATNGAVPALRGGRNP